VGAGRLQYDGLAVTRRLGDDTRDDEGLFIYLRDLDDGSFWSATLQPTRREPDIYQAEWRPDAVHFHRVDAGVSVELTVSITDDVELRRCTIANRGRRPRRIEVTSYLEWVLQDAAADDAHPAFSKLFVETRFEPSLRAIIARRRQRDPKQRILCGAHWIAAIEGAAPGDWQFESSRMAFLGRGGSRRQPLAMTAPGVLPAAVGPVLDPIASLRSPIFLSDDESATITFATAARGSEAELLDVLHAFDAKNHVSPASTAPYRIDSQESPLIARNRYAHNGDGEGSAATRRYDSAHRSQLAAEFQPATIDSHEVHAARLPSEALQFFNGIGGFTARGDQYVIRLEPAADGRLNVPPLPWSHVVANPKAGFIATETGAGYTWTANSRENRLTHWSNDPVSDPHSEAIYLRDHEQGEYWSPTPGPAGVPVQHEIRYGFGSVAYRHISSGLDQRVLQFVPMHDPIKITRVELQNRRAESRSLDAFFYAHLALGNGDRNSLRRIRTWFDSESSALFAANPARELENRIAFAALVAPLTASPPEYTADRREFIGASGDLAQPHAVRTNSRLSGRCGEGLDARFALKQNIELAPQQTQEFWIVLGEAESESDARKLISHYSEQAQLDASFAEVQQFWQDLLSAVQVETPSSALNLMVNGWLPYQNISCRMWGRSAYYQSGGAYGFRDQLQDAAALIYHDPAITREQILRHAASQFVEGDVLHWWHPPASRGIRTRFADDLLWLPLLACEYVAATGDHSIWDEQQRYLAGPLLEPGEQEKFFTPTDSGQSGSIYEHCCRAVDRSLTVGEHGLPLFGCGDWNDGMNRVGQNGRGESVWMGFFLYHVLEKMIPVCLERRGDARARRYRQHQEHLQRALNTAGWDGQWYRRAYFDNGEPLGTAAADECQIDALVQAWSVLSASGDHDKARQSLDAVDRRLVRPAAMLIQLLDPPFDRMPLDPGYIKGYLPGIRENGGQYTHGVLWFVRAMAEIGRGSRAVELLELLNPILHARTPDEVAVYQAEPYVVAADVYSQPPHAGRAGWTWYTGSAGWMFRVAVESILGMRIHEGRELWLNPCISKDWPKCRLSYRLPNGGGAYRITIENPQGRETAVAEALIDGKKARVVEGVARIPLAADGAEHHVLLRI
jgi:cyclic beta-1,2-glucan synthetase